MKNKKQVLILGGSGFIGSNLAQFLSKKGFSVTSTYLRKKKIIKGVKFIKIDLKNFSELSSKLCNENFDYVINCSGYIDHSTSLYLSNNIFFENMKITSNLCNFFLNKKIKKFINLGSSDEYGFSTSPQKESQILKPQTMYALAKCSSNLLLQSLWLKDKFPVVILRLFLIYGNNQSQKRLIPYVINKIKKKQILKIFNGGNQIKDFFYIEDLCEVILYTFTNSQVDGHTINIGSGNPIKIKKVIQKIEKILGKGNVQYIKNHKRITENINLWPNITKMNKLIKIRKFTSLEEGLKKTINSSYD